MPRPTVGSEYPKIHVCRGTGRFYLARWRSRGQRHWTVLETANGKMVRYRDAAAALRALSRAAPGMPDFYHGDVTLCADYYEPTSVYEIWRK
jgi:hypothetical protein